MPVASRDSLYAQLQPQGFSEALQLWMGSSLVPVAGDKAQGLAWAFDAHGAAEMYASYQAACYWDLLRRPPAGTVNVVRAERSDRWTAQMVAQLDDAVRASQVSGSGARCLE